MDFELRKCMYEDWKNTANGLALIWGILMLAS